MDKTFAFHTLGCKLNFSESSSIAQTLRQKGYQQVEFKEQADLYVINTCSVTEIAEKKSRQFISQAHHRNPQADIFVVGCYSELKSKEISMLDGVKAVLGNTEKFKLLEFIDNKTESRIASGNVLNNNEFFPSFSEGDRTRSFFKIQDGCDYYCSYCTVPYARGHSRSATIEQTIETAKTIASKGIKEIILSGINLGDFGSKNNETLLDLLKELVEIEDIKRIRLSSIEPNLLNDDIINFVSLSDKMMPHFHIPLQSGSNEILTKMKRRYDTALFVNRIETIVNKIPDSFIAVDVIAGFPGETQELFEQTYDLLNSLPIAFIHVFTYSDREKSLSTNFVEKIDVKERKLRSKKLQELSNIKKTEFYNKYINDARHVLFESSQSKGYIGGFTDNYLRVITLYDKKLVNTISKAKLKSIDINTVFDCNLE